jgi:autotransporter adhesin
VAPGIGYYDAVNMSQLRDVTLALGSGNFDSVTGVWTNPTFTVPTVTGSTTYSNVSAALTGLGVRVTALENKSASTGTGVPGPAGPTGPQGPQGPQGVAGTDGGGMTAAQVTSLAQTQANTALTQANSYTDQQIGSLSSQINGLGQQIAGLGQQINNVDRDAREGIASTAALTRTAAAPYAPGHTVVMTGGAVYRGQAAGAIGVSRWSDNGLNNVNVGFAYGGGNSQVFSAGFAHIF